MSDAPVPARPSLPKLRAALPDCRACELWADATQVVPGDGSSSATVMFVGEQPGDSEDRSGVPFTGPAGRLLDRALEEAGIDRGAVYVTNAVKHFRFRQRGKRRIHQRPDSSHIGACRPWLDAELAVVRPEALVCLGATAAQSLLGRGVRVTQDRGKPLESELAPWVMVTVHPSSILRARGDDERKAAYRAFVDDLGAVAVHLDD
jgi:uracil-DNA glycosylase family protein